MLDSVFQAGPCLSPGVRPAQDPANQKSQHTGGRTHQVSIIGEELVQVDECWEDRELFFEGPLVGTHAPVGGPTPRHRLTAQFAHSGFKRVHMN